MTDPRPVQPGIASLAQTIVSEALRTASNVMTRKRLDTGFWQAFARDLAPLRQRLETLADELDTDDVTARETAVARFQASLPDILRAVRKGGATEDAMSQLLEDAAADGIERRTDATTAANAEHDNPPPSKDALDFLRQKTTLPTDMRTKQLAKLPADLRERAAFSAGVTQAEFIDRAYDSVRQLVSGTTDRATMRLRLKQMLAGMDYQPENGKDGTLQDLSSDARLNVILDTNYAQARGYAWDQAGQDQDLLDTYPAEEFLRVEDRDHPRTTWPALWNAKRAKVGAEGATDSGSGRMVALKNHPIWRAINRFGVDYEPFDFGSGMGKEDVDREDAVALGIIKPNQRVEPRTQNINDNLAASPSIQNASLRKALEATGLGSFDASGVFRFNQGAA